MASKFDLSRGLFRARNVNQIFIVTEQRAFNRPLKMYSSLYLQTYISSLVVMIHQNKKVVPSSF